MEIYFRHRAILLQRPARQTLRLLSHLTFFPRPAHNWVLARFLPISDQLAPPSFSFPARNYNSDDFLSSNQIPSRDWLLPLFLFPLEISIRTISSCPIRSLSGIIYHRRTVTGLPFVNI